ncbi:hypothetical protein HNQ08_003069 [Deinococcus humi]|uniref:Uncharacterized protein n=1 Tax=Deinococcus humi TaxID=662880 RepID=A0A7W8NHG0_9DEIO|nr:hypothetical protein [Deinococcus humi]
METKTLIGKLRDSQAAKHVELKDLYDIHVLCEPM